MTKKMMMMVTESPTQSLHNLAKDTGWSHTMQHVYGSLYHKDGPNHRNEDKILGQTCPKCPSYPWHRICFLNAKTHGQWIPLVWNLSAILHHFQFFIIRTDLYCSIICFHSNIELNNLMWKQGHCRLLQEVAFIDDRRQTKGRYSVTKYGKALIEDYEYFRRDTFFCYFLKTKFIIKRTNSIFGKFQMGAKI